MLGMFNFSVAMVVLLKDGLEAGGLGDGVVSLDEEGVILVEKGCGLLHVLECRT